MTQPLRILHVISALAPGYGGPTIALHAMTRALAERGHLVTVATTDAGDDQGGRLDIQLSQPLVERGVTYRYFARRPATRWKFSWGLTRWLRQEVGSFDVAHVHALFQYPTLAACRIARRRSVPYILRPLGTLDAWSLGQRAWKKRPYLEVVERAHIRHAAALHATSDSEAGHLRRLGARRIEVIPLGVDAPDPAAARRTSAVPGAPLRVLFLSRLHPKKGIPVLLEAVRQARARSTAVVLTIAGAGTTAYEAELRALAATLGVADAVTWAGHVDGEAKSAVLAEADVFVLPSSQENFGIAVAEALAAGLPALVSREVAIAGDVEAAGAGRALPIDPARFADALVEYAERPDARLAAGRAAAGFARAAYSWPACAERLEVLYADVSARSARSDTPRPLARAVGG